MYLSNNLDDDERIFNSIELKRIVGTSTKVEKQYLRLTTVPDPSEIRDIETLKKAFKLLKLRWKTKKDYLYVGNQFKSLRQDLQNKVLIMHGSRKIF